MPGGGNRRGMCEWLTLRSHRCSNSATAWRSSAKLSEEHMPIGVLPSHDHTGIEPLEEVEAIVRAIHAVAENPGRRRLSF